MPEDQNESLAIAPTEELLALPFIKAITDTLKAYQYSKRCNVLRVIYEAERKAAIKNFGGLYLPPHPFRPICPLWCALGRPPRHGHAPLERPSVATSFTPLQISRVASSMISSNGISFPSATH